MKIIIYASKYGTTKKYALELSKKTGIKAVDYHEVDDIDSYDVIIYLGALYAGGVLGMKKTFGKLADSNDKRIIIVTVGLADPLNNGNINTIKDNIKRQLPDNLYNNVHLHFLRGRIDYSRLGLKHKMMMGLLYRKAKRLNDDEKTAEVQAMIETYGKTVNFMDFNSLNPIIDYVNNIS